MTYVMSVETQVRGTALLFFTLGSLVLDMMGYLKAVRYLMSVTLSIYLKSKLKACAQ